MFLVSAVALHRDGVAAILAGSERVRMLGTAGPGQDAIGKLRQLRPDVVLLDLPAVKALSFARLLRDAVPETRLAALGVGEVEDEVIACAEAGILGYVLPDASAEELVAAIEGVARDELLCSPRVSSGLMRRVGTLAREQSGPRHPKYLLTARERQVLELLAQGRSNKEIAALLCIEFPTVKTHVHNILEKLGVHRRGEAAALVRAGTRLQGDGVDGVERRV